MLELAVPTLAKAGLFDLFAPDEWAAGGSPGRRLEGLKAKVSFDAGLPEV